MHQMFDRHHKELPCYRQLNPQVLVPLLVLEDKKSKPLGQSLAIMEFLEVRWHPDASVHVWHLENPTALLV